MIAGSPARQRGTLDPDQNNSNQRRLLRGHYRRQYMEAARNGLWGTEAGTCGVRTMWRIEDGAYRIMPAVCARWTCLMCGPMKAAWLKRELNLARARHCLDYFWTLTIWTETMPAAWSDLAIAKFWNNLRTKLVKYYGRIAYVWIREHTQQGYAHLHLLCDLPIEQSDLSDLWKESSGGSYIVDAEPVESDQASDYLAKYCTQEATARAQPGMEHMRGRRLFSCSRGIKFAPFKAPGTRVEHLDEETGELTMRSAWRIMTVPYWSEHRRLVRAHGPPIIERIAGQPSATFDTSRPEYSP
jgi:hypothetical protein